MTKTFKYTDEETYNEFILNLTTKIEDDPLQSLIQPSVIALVADRVLPEGWNQDKALQTTECILHALEEYEEYEICQEIIIAYPELNYQK